MPTIGSMSANQIRVTVSSLYAVAILAALFVARGTFLVVVIVGAVVVGLAYAVTATRASK